MIQNSEIPVENDDLFNPTISQTFIVCNVLVEMMQRPVDFITVFFYKFIVTQKGFTVINYRPTFFNDIYFILKVLMKVNLSETVRMLRQDC